MTMLITKFHKLIGNKLVWIFFLFVVVISFVVWGMQTPKKDDGYQARAPATLNGEPVPKEEFSQAEFGSYFRLMLQSGRRIPFTAEVKDKLAPIAWKRLISLKTAEKLGLVAGDDEIRDSLENTSFLSPNGQFDPAQYEMFIQQALPNLLGGRITKQQFEDHVRREISLNKLMSMVTDTVLVAPADVEQVFHTLNDKFIINYAMIESEQVEDLVAVTDDQVRAYYDEHPDTFEVPERVAVRYVKIPVAPFLDEVQVEEKTVEAYYQANLDSYQQIDTNAVPAELTGETNAVDAAAAVTYRSLEEVHDEIVAKLKHDKARFKAVELANDLVYALTPDQFGRAPSFDDKTTSMGLEIHEVPPFTRYQPVEAFGVDADPIQDQAFQLYPNPDEYFSNPVDTKTAVYVLALKKRLPPHIPPFEEVADEVRPYARRAATSEEMRAAANRLIDAFHAGEATAEHFTQAAADAGLTATNLGPFSAVSVGDDLPSSDTVMEALVAMNRGEISEPLLTDQGLMVAFVSERIAATDEAFRLAREQLTKDLRQQYAIALFDDWQQQLLKDADFTPREEPAEEEAPAEEPARNPPEAPAGEAPASAA